MQIAGKGYSFAESKFALLLRFFRKLLFRTGNLDFIFNKHELFIVSSGHPAIGPEFGDVSGGSAERRHLGQNREKKIALARPFYGHCLFGNVPELP